MGSQKDHGHQASSHPTIPLPVSSRLCPQDVLPALVPGEASLDATTGGRVAEEEENSLFQQMNCSESQQQGGMAIPAHIHPYRAGHLSRLKDIPTTYLGGYKRFSAVLGKQEIY